MDVSIAYDERTNSIDLRLLRARRQRPRSRSPAEQRDELAASNSECHLIPPAERTTEG